MTWNYRLCKSTYKDNDYDEVSYEIKEAYYNKAGQVWAVTENRAGVFGETVEEAKRCLEMMKRAFEEDVLDMDTFVFAKADFEEGEEE